VEDPNSRLILFPMHLGFLITTNHNCNKLIAQKRPPIDMTYRNLEHMTDAFIEVSGATLDEAFEAAGMSVVDTILDISLVDKKSEKKIQVSANDLKGLLYSWLEEIIILTITEGFACRTFKVKIAKDDKYFLKATVTGEPLDFDKHHFKLEIKAPTYHLMEIKQEKAVVMRYLLDL
jgi:SHS2 domain-containing protein